MPARAERGRDVQPGEERREGRLSYTKIIVCLANSRKYSGRCVAGKEVTASGYGGWVRPVSARPSAELSEEERRYPNGDDPRVLDVISVPLMAAAPILYQTENHVIDRKYYWERRGRVAWERLARLVDETNTLWAPGNSSYYGRNDRLTVELAGQERASLLLIEPETLVMRVLTEGEEFGNPRRRVRAQFDFGGIPYLLAVTDPVAERAFLSKPDGDYVLEEAYLTVSLGEPHTDDCCYKLVAAVVAREIADQP